MSTVDHTSGSHILDRLGRSETSFEDFYSAYFHTLTIQLCAYTGDLATAQDVTQEAFCRALTRWPKVSTFDDPAAWVRRVAWNLAISRWRRVSTATRFLRQQRPQFVRGPSPDRVALERALGALPARHRRAVILFYLADLPVSEIAEQEGVAEATVRSWLHRGRSALATQLTDKENDRD